MKFFTCEILNFINVLGQIYFTDMFLGYQFTKYGRDVFSISEQDLNTRVDPLHKVNNPNSFEIFNLQSQFQCQVFPKIAKCNFKFYGPSGTIQKADALCVLPLNIINEKIYIALYFWFIFLAAVSAVGLLYRLLTILSFDLRVSNIHLRSDSRVDKNLITLALAHPHHTMMERLGDYLLLYLITKNVNPLIIKVCCTINISFSNIPLFSGCVCQDCTKEVSWRPGRACISQPIISCHSTRDVDQPSEFISENIFLVQKS